MTPDLPLLLFCTGMFWAIIRLSLSRRPIWWLVAGLMGGLALLSKYTAALAGLSVLAWALATPENRRWFATPWPWLAGLLAICIFSPVLIWNAQNDWLSFFKQGGRLARQHVVRPELIAEYIAGQVGLLTPLLFLLLIMGVWHIGRQAWAKHNVVDVLIALWFAIPATFYLLLSPFMRVQGNWPAPMWIAAVVATALYLFREKAVVRHASLVILSLGGGASLVLFLWIYAAGPISLCIKADPIAHLFGKRQVTRQVLALADHEKAVAIVSPDYATAAWLRFYSKSGPPVVNVAAEPRYVGFRIHAIKRGRRVLIVSKRELLPRRIRLGYDHVEAVMPIDRFYKGCKVRRYFVFKARKK